MSLSNHEGKALRQAQGERENTHQSKASAYQGKPVNLDDIIEAIEAGNYRFTDHGKAEAANDGLTEAEITFSVIHGEML